MSCGQVKYLDRRPRQWSGSGGPGRALSQQQWKQSLRDDRVRAGWARYCDVEVMNGVGPL